MKKAHVYFQKIILFMLAFSVVAYLTGPSAQAGQIKRDYWPTIEWRTSAPEKHGMDPAKLMLADQFIEERLPDAFSLVVVKNGYLVLEKYYRWGSPNKYAVVHSVTKSVTSSLIGIALEEGYLNSVDQKLIEFFPEYFNGDTNPRKKEIRLKHILTMSAGFQWEEWGPDIRNWYMSPDWISATLQLPQENDPGKAFNYNTSISHLLSAILSRSVKTSTLDFAKKKLFEPIGIKTSYWHQGPQGYHIGGFGLGMSTRDLAKFGFLYLNNGKWDGQSIVPEDWVKASTQQRMSSYNLYGPIGYGYHWWIKAVDGCFSYRAIGRRGQYITIIPELDMVIVVTSNTHQSPHRTSQHYTPLFELVAKAVNRERPPLESIKPTELPPDVGAFIADFNQAIADQEREKFIDHFSDRYLGNGIGKKRTTAMLLDSISYLSRTKVILTRFEQEGNIARIEGVIKDKYFEIPLMPGDMLIKENGQWKWYGNQVKKPNAILVGCRWYGRLEIENDRKRFLKSIRTHRRMTDNTDA